MSKKNRGNKSQKKKETEFQYRPNSKRAKLQQEKSAQRIEPVAPKNKFSPDDLSFGISQIEPLFTEANNRIKYIKSQGFTSYAIEKLEAEGDKDYFDASDITNRESLLEHMYRVRLFLNDKGSTIDGAILQTAEINAAIYKGKFGNEYYTEEHGYAKYDTKVIEKNAAARAFESYRNLESTKAGKFALGEGSYGSENLITALYDAEIRGYDSLVYGNDLLEQYQKEQNKLFEKPLADADETQAIMGRAYDNITGRYGY